MLLAASADCPASVRTCSATTANPLPASPERAASIAAFSERIFVWDAISSIVFTTFIISLDFSSMVCMALIRLSISLLQVSIRSWVSLFSSFARPANCAVESACCSILLTAAPSACTDTVCSSAPCESDSALDSTCPASSLTWLETCEISFSIFVSLDWIARRLPVSMFRPPI